jgi:hypothetical protein
MDLDEAIKRAVLAFYTNNDFATSYEKASGKKVRHNKEFFDNYEKDLRKRMRKAAKKNEESEELMEESDAD